MKEYINEILNSNLYALLFGSGGVLIIVLGIITFFKKKKNKSPTQKSNTIVNINISDTPNVSVTTNEDNQNGNSENNSQKTNTYNKHSFGSEEFYILFLSQIEEKRKAKDDISYE